MTGAGDILVIGGGVIGVCSAYYLAQRGFEVKLLEAGEICAGASFGNAGLILPSHIEPLATPNALGQGLRWLLNPESPFYIKPRLSLSLVSWLWRFRAASKEERVRVSMGLLQSLSSRSVELYRELAKLTGMAFGYEELGSLHLFKTSRGYQDALTSKDLMRTYGIEARLMTADEINEVDPNCLLNCLRSKQSPVCAFPEGKRLSKQSPIHAFVKTNALNIRADVRGGLYFPGDSHLVPADFVVQLGKAAVDSGVDIRTGTEVLGFETSGPKITAVKTTRGDFQPDQIVLAGGAWSPELSRALKLRLPIQPAKGYSLTYKSPENPPSIPVMLSEARVAVTPMGRFIRFAGTLELAGHDMSINERRINTIMRQAAEYLPWTKRLELVEIWRGLRPCTPDGLPVISRPGRYENLIVAAGHATIGMVLGPVTGLLVAQLASFQEPEIDITGLRLERFS
jgi:D-amino-acid dehydrogenase